jgi:hypothetical protein
LRILHQAIEKVVGTQKQIKATSQTKKLCRSLKTQKHHPKIIISLKITKNSANQLKNKTPQINSL